MFYTLLCSSLGAAAGAAVPLAYNALTASDSAEAGDFFAEHPIAASVYCGVIGLGVFAQYGVFADCAASDNRSDVAPTVDNGTSPRHKA